MRRVLQLLAFAGVLHAASIRGTVVENLTARPLARALVTLEPVRGTPAEAARTRTDVYGAFDFTGLPEGAYLVTASRRGFAEVRHGQKRWKAAGLPIRVEQNGAKSLNFQLPRLGAIAGQVVDENDVGLPEHDIVAYKATRPPQLVARAKTDDRGRYRLSGLDPGRYLIRTVAKQYEDGGYVPTYYKDSPRVYSALAVDVDLDQQIEDINVRPAPGRLFQVRGQIYPASQVNVTLISDTGAETTVSDAEGNFQFNPAGPGPFEIYAQAPGEQRGVRQAAYQSLIVDRDRTDLRLTLRPLPEVQVVVRDRTGQAVELSSVRLMARRRDLAGTGKTQTLELPGDRLEFLPGRWEVALVPAPAYYVAGFSTARYQRSDRPPAAGWNEVTVSGPDVLQFLVSANPGSIHGSVTGRGHNPVPGAPVYLELYDAGAHRRLGELQVTRTNLQGEYDFAGLAPGDYRVLSSFDWDTESTSEMPAARSLRVEEGKVAMLDLELAEVR